MLMAARQQAIKSSVELHFSSREYISTIASQDRSVKDQFALCGFPGLVELTRTGKDSQGHPD